MISDYSYQPRKKRMVPLLGLAAVLVLAVIGSAYDVSRWIWIVLAPITATLVFLLMGKQRFGMRIEGDEMIIGIDPVRQRLKMADIDMLIISRQDDRFRYEFKMKDGQSQFVLPLNMPPPRAIVGQMEMRGISTEIEEAAI
ncbi:MAG: hypothetical protein AAF583_04990 [Pseudomonadota bacterium]